MNHRILVTGAAAGTVMLVSRVLQMLVFTNRSSTEWWTLELLRWGLWIAIVALLLRALTNIQTQLHAQSMELEKQKAKLEKITQEAVWKRLELDVVDLNDYRQVS